MRREAREHQTRLHTGTRSSRWPPLAAITAVVLCQFGPIAGRPVLGYAATLFAVAATALICAGVRHRSSSESSARHLKKIAGAAGLIAGRSLVASLARTSIVVTALATAIAMMVSVGIMVGSFRETVQVWLESQLRADIYLRAAGTRHSGHLPSHRPPSTRPHPRTSPVSRTSMSSTHSSSITKELRPHSAPGTWILSAAGDPCVS